MPRLTSSHRRSSYARILILQIAGMGDRILATLAIGALFGRFPGAAFRFSAPGVVGIGQDAPLRNPYFFNEENVDFQQSNDRNG